MEHARIIILDVDYRTDHAVAAWLIASDWKTDLPIAEGVVRVSDVQDYCPGSFYKRELPPLREALAQCSQSFDMIMIDGYVWLDEQQIKPGLGAHLYHALDQRYPIVGVAKNRFKDTRAIEIQRGNSQRPLHVTTAGCDAPIAAQFVQAMHGPHRIPTLLKRVDRLCRDAKPCIT